MSTRRYDGFLILVIWVALLMGILLLKVWPSEVPETYIGTPLTCELVAGTDVVHCEEG